MNIWLRLTLLLVLLKQRTRISEVRDLPERTLERLKRRARLHHRSLQGELHAILEAAAELPAAGDKDEFRLLTVAVILGHNLLDGIAFAETDWRFIPWALLHDVPRRLALTEDTLFNFINLP